MKRFLTLCLCALAALAARPAAAQVFGQFASAEPVGMNARLGGAYLSFSGSEATLLGQLRLSFYPGIDFGFQGGLSRIDVAQDTRTAVKIGGDLKGQVMKASVSQPLDVALGAAIGIETAEDYTILSVGPSLVASRTLKLGATAQFVPYAGVTLLFSRLSVGPANTTDLSLPLRFGAEFRPNPELHLVGEVHIGVSDAIRDDVKFTLGANFPF